MITRSQMPRQMYGLGSLVKKAVKGVKNVIKSPIGKAAIAGAIGFGIPGTSFGGVFGKGALSGLIGKAGMMRPGQGFGGGSGLMGLFSNAKNAFTGLGTVGKIFAGGAGIKMLSGLFPQEEGEDDDTYADRISKLEPLLDRYYKNVNRNASPQEIKDFITANTQEYMAKGGRVGYRLGGDTMDREGIKSLEAGAPDVKYTGDMRLASESGPEEFELDLMSELMQAFEEAKRQGFEGDFKSFLDMYMGSQAQAPEGIMQEAPIQMAANGGRIGFKQGSPDSESFKQYKQDLEYKIISPDTTFNEWLDNNAPDPDYDYSYSVGGRVGLMKGAMPMEEDEEDSYRAGVMSAMMGRKKVMGGGMIDVPTGIMRMNQGGVMERDYRDEGGFVPVGVKEKADDVPAMLSKNEFVMTADAVRAAGGGSVQKGAQKMYDTMKSLERKVS